MKRILPLILVSAALGVSWVLSKKGAASRESLLPVSRVVAEQTKGFDRTVAVAFPLSTEEERRIGAEIDRSLSVTSPILAQDDAIAVARWREFGSTAANSSLVGRFRGRYEFRATPAGGPNAFALPGGFIYGTLPLLRALGGDSDALLFTLGHEIGHVELGHCADAYRLRAGARDPITAVLGGALTVGRLFAQLSFSSTQELEADAFAVKLVRSVHGDPRGALRAFDALGVSSDAETKRGPGTVFVEGLTDYFHTHPGAWERRSALEREIAALK